MSEERTVHAEEGGGETNWVEPFPVFVIDNHLQISMIVAAHERNLLSKNVINYIGISMARFEQDQQETEYVDLSSSEDPVLLRDVCFRVLAKSCKFADAFKNPKLAFHAFEILCRAAIKNIGDPVSSEIFSELMVSDERTRARGMIYCGRSDYELMSYSDR